MGSQALHSAVRRLRHVVAPPTPPAGADAELLRDFTARRDAAAFAQIVRRHGPMVLGVCRRVVRDPSDADDAFQATFLVLIRKAGSLRAPDRLAGWLHQVAHRVARKARAMRLNRARREGDLFDLPTGEPPAEVVWRELRPIFDAELARLPDRLRLPAVLCLLEGQSKREAAEALGWPEGTLSCRLQRARERLRARLSARGLTLSAGALAVALFEGAGTAAVPDRLIASTLQGLCAPAAAAGARALADGVTQAMYLTKVKAIAAGLLVAGVVGTGTGVALVPGAGPSQVVAVEPVKGGPPKEAAPAPREAPPGDQKALAEAIERARQNLVISDLQVKQGTARTAVAARELQELLRKRRDALRLLAEQWQPLVAKGVLSRAEWERLQGDLKAAEAELKKATPAAPPDLDLAIQEQELELLKERLAFEEQMFKKGYIAEGQVKLTRLKVAQAEATLAKAGTAKPVDPRQAAAEEVIRKLEQIVEQTRQGVERGIVPVQELLNSQATLARYRFELLTLDRRPVGATQPVTAEQRAALEAVIQKMEEIVAKTAEGVDRGIVPQQELLNAQAMVLEHRFKLIELTAGRTESNKTEDRPTAAGWQALIANKERELAQAEDSLKRRAMSAEEVSRLRVELGRLKADAAAAAGDHAAAVKLRERVVTDLEAVAALARVRVERKTAPHSELRAAEVAVAEARVEAMRAGIRRQLAEIVASRELDLKSARAAHERGVIPAVVVQQVEVSLAEAKLRLAAER